MKHVMQHLMQHMHSTYLFGNWQLSVIKQKDCLSNSNRLHWLMGVMVIKELL